MEGSLPVQSQFTVGISVEGKGDRLVVRAEDALIAALKVKAERPEATITYVRRPTGAATRAIRRIGSPKPAISGTPEYRALQKPFSRTM